MSFPVLVHVGLAVSDIARSERFYTEVFGFGRDRDLKLSGDQIQGLMQLEPKSDIHAVYLMLANFTLELLAFDPPSSGGAEARVFNQTGLTHLSLGVADVAVTCAQVLELGGTVLCHRGRAAVLRDPDGQLIEIMEASAHKEIEAGRTARRKGALA
jgi:catechol 2,3-dioxygenase-like lactoylglutathione lyase family enzyme